MANRIKLKGTSERSFDIGLGPKQTFDANGLTANRTWVLPDSNGTNGYVLSTDGSGNLSWAAQTGGSGTQQPQIAFTAATTGTNQTFSNANLASFANGTYANLFVNGVLLQTSEYSITGTTATISTYLNSGDYIQVAATGAGGGGGGTPAGTDTQVQFNNGGVFAANSGFTYNTATQTVAIGTTSTSATITIYSSTSTLATDQTTISSGVSGGVNYTELKAGKQQQPIVGNASGHDLILSGGIGSGSAGSGGNVIVQAGKGGVSGSPGVVQLKVEGALTTGTFTVDQYGGLLINGSAGTSGQFLRTGGGSGSPATWATPGPTTGGTGFTTYATGDIIYASATNTLAKRAAGATGTVLTMNGGVPTWQTPSGGETFNQFMLMGA